MNLKELKLSLIESKTQVIVFGKDGTILDSCQSMVNIAPFIKSSLYDMDPLFKSMEFQIRNLDTSPEDIFIPCVEFDFIGRKGFYDFQICVHPDSPQLRAWLIIDNSAVYKYYQKIQQQRNELLIEKELKNKGFG